MRFGLAIVGCIAGLGCGGDDAIALMAGQYAMTTTDISIDDCRVAGTIGAPDNNYGQITVSPMQVTHTDHATFQNEIYMRAGNHLTRDASAMLPETGNCVLDAVIHDDGNINSATTIDLARTASHSIHSGDCSGVVGSTCQSKFKFRLSRL
jgi:hypothetical protein